MKRTVRFTAEVEVELSGDLPARRVANSVLSGKFRHIFRTICGKYYETASTGAPTVLSAAWIDAQPEAGK